MDEKIAFGTSKACEKLITLGTDEKLLKLVPVPVPGHTLWARARVPPLELVPVPKFVLGHHQKSHLCPCPVPEV